MLSFTQQEKAKNYFFNTMVHLEIPIQFGMQIPSAISLMQDKQYAIRDEDDKVDVLKKWLEWWIIIKGPQMNGILVL